MRPIWKGSISFGLVNIPVSMFSGVNPHEGLDLTMLHSKDHSPVRYARICRKDGEEVAWDDIVKGYEYQDDQYVVLTPKDFEKANPRKTQTVDIKQFSTADEIDIRYFEKPYYLEPVKGGEKAYALLRGALEKSQSVAIVSFVIHEREHLGMIVPLGRALILNQMRYPTDLRSGHDLELPTSNEVSARELEIALKLVEQETKPFVPEDFHDSYTEELENIIKAKAKGQKAPAREASKPRDTTPTDLMATLKASLTAKR